jgi:hypothetical protein
MQYRHGTPLERELLSLEPEKRAARLQEVWKEFQGTRAFDLLTITLRDTEWEALQRIRTNPLKEAKVAAVMMHVVNRIRQQFEALGRGGEENPSSVEWQDDVEFWDLDVNTGETNA